jgi:O-acetyl-ADP-ribose deacetylase (regulator of RNase III)
MPINLKRGDLLKDKSEAITNTVNCVGVMGKGIALQFKQRWPQNFKAYATACKNELLKPGKVFIHDMGRWAEPRYIINFPTKVHWRGDSKIEDIESGLRDLIAQAERLGIKSIALPPLGCGNGGLDWGEVKRVIIDAFKEHPDIQVNLFEPQGAPRPQDLVIQTQKPRLTAVRAAIIRVISTYREMEYELSHLEVQKLAYFLEEAGEPLNLDFVKQNYGPYSDKLRHVLRDMDSHYITGVGDFSRESEISILPGALAEADAFIKSQNGRELSGRMDRIVALINGFETPHGMELLATVHWVATRDPKVRTVDDAIEAVHNWNPRKRAVLSEDHIKIAWRRLHDTGWLHPGSREKKYSLPLQ